MFHSYVTNNQRVFHLKTQANPWGIPQPGDVAPLQHRAEGRLRTRREVAQRADVASGKIRSFLCFHVEYCICFVFSMHVFDVVQAWVYYIIHIDGYGSKCTAPHLPSSGLFPFTQLVRCHRNPEPTKWVGQTMPKYHMSDEFYQLVPS